MKRTPPLVIPPSPSKPARKSIKLIIGSLMVMFTVIVLGTVIGLPAAVQIESVVGVSASPTPSATQWQPTKGQLEATEYWKSVAKANDAAIAKSVAKVKPTDADPYPYDAAAAEKEINHTITLYKKGFTIAGDLPFACTLQGAQKLAEIVYQFKNRADYQKVYNEESSCYYPFVVKKDALDKSAGDLTDKEIRSIVQSSRGELILIKKGTKIFWADDILDEDDPYLQKLLSAN